jgi:hypothetical protein
MDVLNVGAENVLALFSLKVPVVLRVTPRMLSHLPTPLTIATPLFITLGQPMRSWVLTVTKKEMRTQGKGAKQGYEKVRARVMLTAGSL